MKYTLLCCSAILAIHSAQLTAAAPIQLTSPNGKLVLGLSTADSGTFGYSLAGPGTPLISHSALGLDFGPAGKAPASGWKIAAKYPELLRFIASQQHPWRESKTLSGVIGEHIVMARQSAKGVWLVGAATNEDARELDVKLDFLPPGSYQATIIQDGEDGHYQKNRETLRVEKHKASPADTLRIKLAPGGGACLILEKQPTNP